MQESPSFPFCPNPACPHHASPPDHRSWLRSSGVHYTKTFGIVPRFQCIRCKRTFSPQTFSLDYYSKKKLAYPQLLASHVHGASLRGLSRLFAASCGTIQNRLERLSRQALALHHHLRPLASRHEDVCIDAFVSFDSSQYLPCEIPVSITRSSRFILDFSHTTRRRSGSTTSAQKIHASDLYRHLSFERDGIRKSFERVLSSLEKERPPRPWHPLVLITDEKKEYQRAVRHWDLYHGQDDQNRVAHLQVNSSLPRNAHNPLFASNYLDREIRKDQAAQHRESVCFNRNVVNGLGRLSLYFIWHNYMKKFRVNAPAHDDRTHAEHAGIPKNMIEAGIAWMFRTRAFLSRLQLGETLRKIWKKEYPTLTKKKPESLPAYALD